MPDSSRVRAPAAGARADVARTDAFLPLAFFAIAALFLYDTVFTGRAYLLRDILTSFHPWQSAVRESVRSGALPFWNHDTYCGLPLLANPRSGVFYPPNWLIWGLPFDVALTAGMVLHLALAAIFMRGFLRRVGILDPAAFVGGALFAFGTWPLAHLGTPTTLGAAVWIPLAWNGTWDGMRDGRRRGAGLAGVAIAMSLLAGDPRVTVLGLASVMLLALFLAVATFRAEQLRKGERAGRLLALPLALILGDLAAGAQLAPAWEAASRAGKTALIPADMAMARSLPPQGIVGLVDPFFLGLPGPDRYWGGSAAEFAGGALYVGALGFVLALASIPAFRRLRRTRRVRREDLERPVETAIVSRTVPHFLALGTLAGLALALGRHVPLWGWLHAHLPGFGMLRGPAIANLLVVMHLAPLAAIGLACLQHGTSRWRLAGLGTIVLGGLMLAASVLARGPLADVFRSWQLAGAPAMQHAAWQVAHVEWARALAVRGEIALVAGVLALALATRARAGVAWGWAGILLLDLFLVARCLGMPAAQGFYDRAAPESAALREQLGGRRLYTPPEVDRLAATLAGCRNPVAFEWAQRALLGNANVPGGIAQARGSDPLGSPRHNALAALLAAPQTPAFVRDRVLDLWDVARLVQTDGIRPSDLPGLLDPSRGLEQDAYTPRLGRATLVSGWRTVDDGASLLETLLAPDHDPARVTLLEPADDGVRPVPPSREAGVRCDAVGYDLFPNRIQAAWHVGEGGMLRVLESWAPGWQARVNGEPAPVYRADYLFLAVPVPAGSVVVELEYRPAAFPAGAAASAAGVLGLLACLAGGRRRVEVVSPDPRQASRRPSGATPRPHGASAGARATSSRTGARRTEVR